TLTRHVKEGLDATEEVRVGEVLVRLGGQKEKIGNAGVTEKASSENIGHSAQSTEKEAVTNVSVFVRKAHDGGRDLGSKWGVATVINGEAISVVQNRIADAGFKELAIIPMGAD
ncbi:hypothetical protein A2U01_0064533, partial [Trifolium medium]|nr:hypothetical protein [Trifolium medium]